MIEIMNSSRKTLLLCLVCLIALFGFFPNTLADTTLGDSSFPLEKDENIRWRTVNATEPYMKRLSSLDSQQRMYIMQVLI